MKNDETRPGVCTFDKLLQWLRHHDWMIEEKLTRTHGTWSLEAISPSGIVMEFAGDRPDAVHYWNATPISVEIVNDEEHPVVVDKASN